jgi:hypothetical protein
MRNSAIGSTEAYSPNGLHHETGVSLTRAALTISNSFVILYMVGIQYILFRIRSSTSKVKHPTPVETYIAITLLWIIHTILDRLLSVAINAIVQILWRREIGLYCQHFGFGLIFDLDYWASILVGETWRRNFARIFSELLATWLIAQVVPLIPLLLEIRERPRTFLERFRTRYFELVQFMKFSIHDQTPIAQTKSGFERDDDAEKICQSIELRRIQEENPVEGERTLNWDLSIDKKALQELMETLGPPGGFGEVELGFDVSKGRIRFGAMGIGTRFNLTFVLDLEAERK